MPRASSSVTLRPEVPAVERRPVAPAWFDAALAQAPERPHVEVEGAIHRQVELDDAIQPLAVREFAHALDSFIATLFLIWAVWFILRFIQYVGSGEYEMDQRLRDICK